MAKLDENAALAAFQTCLQMAHAEQAAADALNAAQSLATQRQTEHQQAVAARMAAVQKLTEMLGGNNG